MLDPIAARPPAVPGCGVCREEIDETSQAVTPVRPNSTRPYYCCRGSWPNTTTSSSPRAPPGAIEQEGRVD